MKNLLKSLIIMTAVFYAAAVFAQAPAPAEQAAVPQTGLVPTEPAKEEVKAVPEQKTLFKVSPSVTLKPVGVDKDVGGGYAYWMEVAPGAGLNTTFFTDSGRTINISLDYTFTYRQFLNKQQEKKIDHNLFFTLSHGLTDKLSLTAKSQFEYWQFFSKNNNGGNEFDVTLTPGLSYKITDKFTASFGYYMLFFYMPNELRTYDEQDAITNPPTDPGDAMRGTLGYFNVEDNSYYPQYSFTDPSAAGVALNNFTHGVKTTLSYQFLPTTNGTLTYLYYPRSISNEDESEFSGHHFFLILGQDVWKGGNINLCYSLRWRRFPYAFTDLGNYKQDLRQRFDVTVSQSVNSYISLESWYRFQYTRFNVIDPKHHSEFYAGIRFGF